MTKIAVFYHCAKMGTYKEVDKEIMQCLKESGIKPNIFIRNECKDILLYEFPTIEMLRHFSITNDYKVLYIHTKGVTRKGKSFDDWRKCMIYWTITRWKECVDKLDEVDAVGPCYCEDPVPHFKGNFWWANASYIRNLPPPREADVPILEGNGRHKAEFWILSGQGKHYCPYILGNDPYGYENPSENYLNKPF